jgi:hypothetical protein
MPNYPYVSGEHACAIGFVAVFWSMAEEMLAWIIHALVGWQVKEDGFAITAQLGALSRINTITTLASVQNQEWFDRWCIIAKAADKVRTRRNSAVHAVWIQTAIEHQTIRTKARSRVKIEAKQVPISELRELQDDMLNLIDALGDFMGLMISNGAHERVRQPPMLPPLTRGQNQPSHSPVQAQETKCRQGDGLQKPSGVVKRDTGRSP